VLSDETGKPVSLGGREAGEAGGHQPPRALSVSSAVVPPLSAQRPS
jgi:hypothetical protein